jgi:UDP-glucose 4-epimerase
VLVTGGLGFIGSNLAIRLVEVGAEVGVVDSLVPDLGGNRFNLAPVADRLSIHELDLRDTDTVAELVDGTDVVFAIAGNVSHVDSMSDPFSDLELNYRAQLSLLEALRRCGSKAKVVYAGSRQQYGRPLYLPVDEKHPLDAIDVNGANKTAAETVTLLYHRLYGFPACSLRLTNTYGPRMQMRHARQGFVAWFVRLALEGRELELYGGGRSLRDFNEVEDVVNAFLLCGSDDAANGEVFNLGHPEPVTIRRFAELLLEVAGEGTLTEREFPADRARIDIGSVYADYGKIRERLGWEPRVELRDGLARMVEYYRANRARYW